jgi:lysylphosphatidylglycerol synthetase-like protein (DUF2156 family)
VNDRARNAEDRVKHASQRTGRFVLEVGAAILVGAGVPVLWVWIGSRTQSSRGSQAVEASTAVIIVLGLLITYTAALIVASMLQARSERSHPHRPSRHPWLRSMRDAPYRPGAGELSPVEAVLVGTAIIASIAMLIWFFAFAGDPLPT